MMSWERREMGCWKKLPPLLKKKKKRRRRRRKGREGGREG